MEDLPSIMVCVIKVF